MRLWEVAGAWWLLVALHGQLLLGVQQGNCICQTHCATEVSKMLREPGPNTSMPAVDAAVVLCLVRGSKDCCTLGWHELSQVRS